MVVLTRDSVVESLVGAELVTQAAEHVYTFDMAAYLELAEERTRWRDLPGEGGFGSANRNAEAIDLVHREIDPIFKALVGEGATLADDIRRFMETGSDALTDETNATRYNLVGFSAAGMLAGLLAGLFAFFVGEPLLDRAIAFEEASASDHHAEEEIFSRTTQEIGLFFATGLFGTTVG